MRILLIQPKNNITNPPQILAADVQAEVEAMPPPLTYSLNPLEPRLPSNTRTINPMLLKSNSKSISELIAPPPFCTDYIYLVRPDYI
jgi:hypothetical protein